MTNHRVGKTNRRIPVPWRMGKDYKKFTKRWWRSTGDKKAIKESRDG